LDGPERRATTLVVAAMAIVSATTCRAAPPPPVDPVATATSPETPADDLPAQARALIREGRLAEARDLLEPELARRPDWAEGLASAALTYLGEGRWEAALGLVDRALAADPELHEAHVPRAWCLYYLGDPAGARAGFEAYLAHAPDYPDALFGLALIAFDADDLAGAEARLRQVVALARARRDAAREALALARLGDVYVRTGDLWRARQELQRSIELAPQEAKPHFKLAHVLQLMGDVPAAQAARAQYEALVGGAPAGDDRPELPVGP
jgi:tetratricopeptide (TPR) repeat protein